MSGLLPPTSGAITGVFGPRDLGRDFSFWHVGSETASFSQYSGAVYGSFHAGTDKAPPYGTLVVASEAGTVIHAGWAPFGPFTGGGYIVDVHIAGGMNYVSCHLSRVLVVPGQKVKRGQTIGAVGSSGNASGAHDHCALYTGSGTAFRYRNPQQYWTGGKYASSPLILPSGVAQKACLNGPGINLRSAPKTTAPIYRTSSSVKSAAWPSGYLLCWSGFTGFKVGGVVNGDTYTIGGVTNNDWVKLWLNSAYRYVARPLLHFV
jgi:murein DD-endopeptidase MepM/ murein hydrolase activator NlpD